MTVSIKEKIDTCIKYVDYMCKQNYLSHPHMVKILIELQEIQKLSSKRRSK